MDLRQLHYFLQIAECRNLTHAAARAWVSQPALSRQLKLLEADLAVQLVERRSRGIVLTEAGELLRARAAVLMRDAQAMRDAVGSTNAELSGTVRLGVTPSLCSMLTAPVAARFHAAHPAVRLTIREGTTRAVREAVAAAEVDVGLFSSEEPAEPLQCEPLLTEQLFAVGCVDARWPAVRRGAISIAQVSRQPLMLTPHPNGLRRIIERAARSAGVTVDARLEVETVALMLNLVRTGAVRAVLPYCAIYKALEAGEVSARPIAGTTISWVIGTSRQAALPRAAQVLIGSIVEHCRQAVADGRWRTARLTLRPGAAEPSTRIKP